MRTIARGNFEGTNDDLRSAVQKRIDAYRAELAKHAKTVGVPAPREDYLIEQLARSGEPFEVEPEPEAPPALSTEQLAQADLETKRANALRALDERRLAAADADPDAPQEVKDYKAALDEAALSN